ncbi:diguanylate cyclase domain-containing protein [Halomonas cupida]|uniref:diguanylate cyclase domain-containing protein n=1 Tax=Halomonas cupida TaxID=44933 RepID=UPI003A9401E6
MNEAPQWSVGLRAISDMIATLMLAGLALWHYLLGEYIEIILPAVLACVLLFAALADLRRKSAFTGWLLLMCGYLMAVDRLPDLVSYHDFWLGALVPLPLLLLPIGPALLLGIVMLPVWLISLHGGIAELIHALPYLTLFGTVSLTAWEHLRQRDLARATDPTDPDCDAINRTTLHERLSGEFDRALHLNQRLAVLILHLPQLDIASEQFGPRAQLAQLDLLCRAVRTHCRNHDFLGREGHADFWLVLPNTTESGALLVLRRLEQALDEVRLTDTGPLTLCTQLCALRSGENWDHFEQRLAIRTQSLTEA